MNFETLLTSKRTISASFFNNYYPKQALQQESKSSSNIVILEISRFSGHNLQGIK